MRKVFGAIGMALALASTVQAQVISTGSNLNVLGTQDLSWKVRVDQILPAESGVTYTLPAAGFNQATVISTPPSPPWAPNTSSYKWIGVSANGTMPTSVGTASGDGIFRFLYTFQTTIVSNASSVTGFMGWDNKIIGYSFGNPLTSATYLTSTAFTPAPDFALAGFCRNGDGEFASGAFPNCLTPFAINANFQAGTLLNIYMTGDGRTDGLLLVTPEPSTYLLVGAGLFGMMAVARRRRSA